MSARNLLFDCFFVLSHLSRRTAKQMDWRGFFILGAVGFSIPLFFFFMGHCKGKACLIPKITCPPCYRAESLDGRGGRGVLWRDWYGKVCQCGWTNMEWEGGR